MTDTTHEAPDNLVKWLRIHASQIGIAGFGAAAGVAEQAAARIEELEAKLKLADVLAHEVERRMVDLGGFDNRFTLRKALEAYRAPLKGQNDE